MQPINDIDNKSRREWLTFSINTSIIIILSVLIIFSGLFLRSRQLINNEIMVRARSYFNSILITRSWNASYGGVYVEKKPGVLSNPWLKNPDIRAADGKLYTKKNPALMTREISMIAEKKGLFTYRITSRRPLNPGNAPDAFESSSLVKFETGVPETFKKKAAGKRTLFRYMAPLRTEQSCLECHASQGYRIGDIRGGISVSFDITGFEKQMLKNMRVVYILFGITIAVMLGFLYLPLSTLMKRLDAAMERIRIMAVTDELSGLYNRRYLFAHLEEEVVRSRRYRHPVGCIMIDIDHFKKINDTHGHMTGDMIIREVADIIRSEIRASDIAARYGGEEMVVLFPETGLRGTNAVARKIHAAIQTARSRGERGQEVGVTVSIGVSALSAEELDSLQKPETIIANADSAMYRAKEEGRNRIVIFGE
jgi:diguanylate cyclase (GGDEF)-like protein